MHQNSHQDKKSEKVSQKIEDQQIILNILVWKISRNSPFHVNLQNERSNLSSFNLCNLCTSYDNVKLTLFIKLFFTI